MDSLGTIIAVTGGPLDFSRWLEVRASAPELEAIEELEGKNPFTGERIAIPARGAARVLREGAVVGLVLWDDGVLIVRGEPMVARVAIRLASSLIGAFELAPPRQPAPKRDPMAEFAERVGAKRRSQQ